MRHSKFYQKPTPPFGSTASYYHGLDIAKAVFMMLGVVFHALYPFRDSGGWVVSYHETHPSYDVVIEFMKAFRMMGFYLLAGFFFAMTVEKYSVLQGFHRRFLRLAIPLCVIGLGAHLWIAKLHNIDVNASYVINGDWLRQLWFIGNLILYDTGAALLFFLLGQRLPKALHFIATMRYSLPFILALLLVGIPVAAYVLRVIANNLILPIMNAEHFFFITPYWLCVYAPYYAFGLLFYYSRHQLMPYLNWRAGILFGVCYILASAAQAPVLAWAESGTLPAMLGKPLEGIFPFMVKTLQMIASLCLLNALAGKAKAFTPIAKASYTIYLLHILVLYTLYEMLEPLSLPPLAFFTLLTSVTFLLTYLLHQDVVTKFPLAKLLVNGAWSAKRTETKPKQRLHYILSPA